MKLVVAGLCCLFVFACGQMDSDKVEKGKVSEEIAENTSIEVAAPDMSSKLPIMNFDEFETKYLQPADKNTTYVINFWATWCKPCVKELPHFEEINATYKNESVKVILVSLDFPESVEKQVLPFIEKHQLKSTVILLDDPDANTWINKVDKKWSGAIPATIILKGDNSQFYEQSFTYSELEKEVKSIL